MTAVSVSLFDHDDTIYRGEKRYLILDFPDFLSGQGFFDPLCREKLEWLQAEYHAERLNRFKFTVEVLQTYYQGLRGQPVHAIEAAALSYWQERFEGAWYPYAAELVALLNQHTRTILISGSPLEPLQYVSSQFNFGELYASTGCVEEGVYTGGYRPEDECATEEAKERLIRQLQERLHFDPERSFAFGDSEGDIPLLKAVRPENAYVLGARKSLKEMAEVEHWNWLERDFDVVGDVRGRIAKIYPLSEG